MFFFPQAKEDAEMMRSLVLPLEDEIRSLKSKLSDAMDKVRKYSRAPDSQDLVGEGVSDNPAPRVSGVFFNVFP